MREAARAKKFGFTQGELERTKADILRELENAYAERDKVESSSFVREYVDNFLEKEPSPGIAYEFELYKRFLPEISLGEVNGLAFTTFASANRIVAVSAPDKEKATIPSPKILTAIVNGMDTMSVTPYEDRVSTDPLVGRPPTPGTIVSRSHRDTLGTTEWKLSNGLRVILKPTDFKNDEVMFSLLSPGGTSLVPDSDYIAATTACAVLQEGGLGSFDRTVLDKMLAGKVASASPFIGELSQGIGGGGSPKDLETIFELVYLTATSPRADTSAFQTFVNRTKTFLDNRNGRPEAAFDDTVQVVMSGHHFRRRPFSMAMLSELNLAKSLAVYRQRFANAAGAVAIIVGSFDEKQIEPLVTRWLGGLPASDAPDTWKDIGLRPPDGIVTRTIHRGIEPKAQVRMTFTGSFTWNRENRYALGALSEVLSIRLRESLRENLGGTYGVSAHGSPSRIPIQQFQMTISFGCEPSRVDELIKATYAGIDSLQTFGPTAAEVGKVRETQLREREVSVKKNSFWMSGLRYCDENSIDPMQLLTYPEMINSLNAAMVQSAAKTYFPKNRVATFILLPAGESKK
jgi:zinc protease